jgi:hypothetical protein
MAKALKAEFSYVRIFLGCGHGYHFCQYAAAVASFGRELAATLPPDPQPTLLNSDRKRRPRSSSEGCCERSWIGCNDCPGPGRASARDDRPVNEFFLLRATGEQIKNIQESQAAWF